MAEQWACRGACSCCCRADHSDLLLAGDSRLTSTICARWQPAACKSGTGSYVPAAESSGSHATGHCCSSKPSAASLTRPGAADLHAHFPSSLGPQTPAPNIYAPIPKPQPYLGLGSACLQQPGGCLGAALKLTQPAVQLQHQAVQQPQAQLGRVQHIPKRLAPPHLCTTAARCARHLVGSGSECRSGHTPPDMCTARVPLCWSPVLYDASLLTTPAVSKLPMC